MKMWLIAGAAGIGLALVAGVVVQTLRLDASQAREAKLVEANKSLKETIDQERQLRDEANRLAREARKKAEEARRDVEKLKRENQKREGRDLDSTGRDLYDRLQRRLQRGNPNGAPSP